MSIEPRAMMVAQSKWNIKCPYSMNAEYITVHNTANDASANNEISYMISNNNEVSYHFAIDDKEVVQGIPLNRNAWHAGDGGSGTGNRKSIGIEICYSLSGGDRFIAAEKLAAKFIAQLLDERGWGVEKVKKHQDWSGKYCPHRTLDMGWQRFLDMVRVELRGIETVPILWTAIAKQTYITNTATALYNIETGQVVRNYSAGVFLELVEETQYGGKTYYRTQYSKDANVNNGFLANDVSIWEPSEDRISWTKLDEPVSKVALRDCKLIDLKSMEIKKEFTPGEKIENLVDYTIVDNQLYYRTEYSREQKKSYGIESSQLGDLVEPEPAPVYPDDVELDPPEDSQIEGDKDVNWVIAMLHTIIEVLKNLFGKGA